MCIVGWNDSKNDCVKSAQIPHFLVTILGIEYVFSMIPENKDQKKNRIRVLFKQ